MNYLSDTSIMNIFSQSVTYVFIILVAYFNNYNFKIFMKSKLLFQY